MYLRKHTFQLIRYVHVQLSTVYKYLYIYMYMTLIIHEILRKTRQGNTTQQKDKETHHNSLQSSYFSRKNWLPQVGLEPTCTTIRFPGNALTD